MMTDTKPRKPESVKSTEANASAPEVADAPVAESSEASEFVGNLPSEASENVSESQSEDKKGGGRTTQKDDGTTPVAGGLGQIQLPPRKMMKQQVRNALVKQETQLLRDAKKYARRGDFFNLNEALAKVREIRLVLSEIVRATFESLRNLWMKHVYNSRD